jgi:hypothetical protein
MPSVIALKERYGAGANSLGQQARRRLTVHSRAVLEYWAGMDRMRASLQRETLRRLRSGAM